MVGCLLVSSFPLACELADHKELVGSPAAVADGSLEAVSPEDHPMAFQRARLDVAGVVSSEALRAMEPRQRVETAGLVVCRQRPATARGIVFLLLEDEHGLVNVLVPRALYEQERERMLVRTSAFLRIEGLLEGHAGAVPILLTERVDRLHDEDAVALRTPDGKSWG